MPATHDDRDEAVRRKALADLAELHFDNTGGHIEAAAARNAALQGELDEPADATARGVRRAVNLAIVTFLVLLMAFVILGIAKVYL